MAGGLSTRMGVEKATLIIKGQPLWARQVQLLRELEPEALLISARQRPAWCPDGIEVVLDSPPSQGPLSGLAAVLGRLQTSHLMTLAVDLPLMEVSFLRKLWHLAEPGCGVVPENEGSFEPLCAIYPAQAAAETAAALEQGDLALQHLVKRMLQQGLLREYAVKGTERALFINVNTAADLERCRTAG
jgi:molybdopterin-guanine dinucleotide biosynthesis protein A